VTGQDCQNVVPAFPDLLPNHMTPASLQSISAVLRRRWVVVALNLATCLGLLAWLGTVLASGG
jgi:hypothetical protein